jgi:hypothetical protein
MSSVKCIVSIAEGRRRLLKEITTIRSVLHLTPLCPGLQSSEQGHKPALCHVRICLQNCSSDDKAIDPKKSSKKVKKSLTFDIRHIMFIIQVAG